MKLSTKGRYGMRAILDLAMNYGQGPISLKYIAQRQEISQKYLERLITFLKLAGLVKSIRGTHGGYILAKHPSKIKLSEVIQVLEGSIALVECVENPKSCPRVNHCATREIWKKMKEAMNNVLESTTLQDLVEQQNEKMQSEREMYYI